MENKETYFEVGMIVYSSSEGRGIVKEIIVAWEYPVVVVFDNGSLVCYTYDGRVTFKQCITLSQNPIEPIVNEPIKQFKKGDLVWVKDKKDLNYLCCIFFDINPDKDSSCKYGVFRTQINYSKDEVYYWEVCVPYNERPF